MDDSAIPAAELDVLACLWKHGELTAREIRETIQEQRPMTHSAVSSLLSRLSEKGLVARVKAPVGKAFVYRPKAHPAERRQRIIGDLLERVFGGDPLSVVASLFETRAPTADELVRLREMVDQLQQQRKPRKKP